MGLASEIIGSWERVCRLEWNGSKGNPDVIHCAPGGLPRLVGVYAWVDTKGRIQKIGKAEGRDGMRQRTSFGRGKVGPDGQPKDATTRLWKRVWEGPLVGESIDVYFSPHPPVSLPIDVPGVGRVTVQSQVARSVEELLSRRAREEREPMLLAGKGN